MLKKRIIPCLDIKSGRTVKGINFVGIKDAGDPIELAEKYANSGADELVFLDITATQEKRSTLIELVEQVAEKIDIPFTVGGGIKSVSEARHLLNAGADKVSINSSAIKNPNLIKELASQFGSQCVVLAVDVKLIGGNWKVFINGGRIETDWEVKDWVRKGVELGAGEILLTSMNNDGTKDGFALEVTNQVCDTVNVPVIASGGAGSKEDFRVLFNETKATAGLAASIFHYEEVGIPSLKEFLNEKNISVRCK
jgi:cyclase